MFHVEHYFKNFFMKILGKLVDIHKRDIYPAEISVSGGFIEDIVRTAEGPDVYIIPGLIDSHIHIESSMVTPGAFGYEAVKHGTVGVISDPHEIANVLGWRGVEFMINDAARSPLQFWFGAPSCVPATAFETSGAMITGEEIEEIMKRPDIKYLSEMMNFPGVIYRDKEVLRKITAARKAGKPVDGHAPGLTGERLKIYVDSGISTDHECSTLTEALEKIALGMKILVREGSAARNLEALKDLFRLYPDKVMLCSDDLHPEMLVRGHMDLLIRRLIADGFDIFDVIKSATKNPVDHYNLDSGLLRKGDKADFIVIGSPERMDVKETWIRGEKMFDNGTVNFAYNPDKPLNNFNCSFLDESDIRVINKGGMFRTIEAFDGELLTKEIASKAPYGEVINPDTEKDILKIVVKERYNDAPAVTGFIKGFGLKKGAFAGSIAHDSHNIICVGTNDRDISGAINEIVRLKGGLAVVAAGSVGSLQLDIGGIMTTRPCREVAGDYEFLNNLVRALGCSMKAPFMTLSFMALLVIPSLKIGDKGLFDVNNFKPVSLFV